MKVAINGAFYQPKGGGIKEYIDNLVHNLAAPDLDIVLYVLQDQLEYAKKNLGGNFKIKKIPFSSGSKYNRIKRSLFENKFWRKEEKEEKFDIFHSPFFHAPKLKKAKVLLTVHDLRLYRFPETYEFFRYHFLKHKVRNSIKRADYIISISDFTKKEIIELCGIPGEKISVIHEAINKDRFADKNIKGTIDIPSPLKSSRFLLSVGHMEPRKNYDRLIDAFQILKKEKSFQDLQLVIVGKKDHSFKETLEKIEKTSDVHYLNFVSGGTLLWLYKNASLFVFPSYYEGFGFPPLEAGALDTISAVSNVSSMPEVCGDAVFYFNPYDVEEISKVVKEALSSPQLIQEKKEKVKNQIASFSWEKNAKETLEIYYKINSKR